ncbi:MAG: 4'-phosphopantetheinyl transferase superfamily protein [Ruminococcus albus]|jgi:4'-phosphopantetheinyl transferase|nr:4'-phosphopantetheinyl transferase superfamily protein [Ruminococcus albus]
MNLSYFNIRDIPEIKSLPKHGMADIWSTDICLDREIIMNHLHYLNADELSRYRRFLKEEDRLRFAGGRIFTKLIAAAYLGIKAEEISIISEKNTKPVIMGKTGLEYNISHSGDMILLAFSSSAEVGVDIEKNDPNIDAALLSTVLHPKEKEAVLRCGTDEFFRIWTGKEAYVKAVGKGFSISPEVFFVKENGTVSSTEEYKVLRIDRYNGYFAAFCYHTKEEKI